MTHSILFRCLLRLSVVLGSIVACSAWAGPAGKEGDHFVYIVEPNDTLLQLSEHYTHQANHWRQLQSLNQIEDVYALPIGKAVYIPWELIPVVATQAVLSHTKGQVWVNDQLATTGQSIQSGDTLRTGTNSFATIQLEDQSSISLNPDSRLVVKQLNAFERARLSDVILELQHGDLEGDIAPENQGVGRFEIQTPMNITGVRGTQLRVRTQHATDYTELLSGQAHLDQQTTNYIPLQAQQGAIIDSTGTPTITALLAAPILGPATQGPKGWQTTLEPIAQAQHYLIQIATDPAGSQVVQRYTVDAQTLDIPLRAAGPGDHYASVRAIDTHGLMGLAAQLRFSGQAVLTSSDGSVINSGSGQAIFLTHY